jgi:hypothetical protein
MGDEMSKWLKVGFFGVFAFATAYFGGVLASAGLQGPAVLLILAAGVGGAIAGYHIGLAKASEVFLEAAQHPQRDAVTSVVFAPARMTAILECIRELEENKPGISRAVPMEENAARVLIAQGFDDAIEVLRAMEPGDDKHAFFDIATNQRVNWQ